MTPLERFEANSAELRCGECKADSTLQQISQDYRKQAAQSDSQLREKQRQERQKRGWS